MICVCTWLKRNDRTSPPADEAHLVHDILWAHALPQHGLQHVRAVAEADGLTVHLFFLTQDSAEAEARAESLMNRAGRSRLMSGFNDVPL